MKTESGQSGVTCGGLLGPSGGSNRYRVGSGEHAVKGSTRYMCEMGMLTIIMNEQAGTAVLLAVEPTDRATDIPAP